MNDQKGATFIEFAVFMGTFIVFGVIAFIKFNELTREAQNSATTAIASSLTANNASNYMLRHKMKKNVGITVKNCTDVVKTLPGGLPAGYSVESYPIKNESSIACTLNGPFTTSVFTATGIS